MVTELSKREKEVLDHLKHIRRNTQWGICILEAIKNPSVARVRGIISELLSQWRDDRRAMMKILGFDLPKILDVKFYKPQDINDCLINLAYPYRVIEEVRHTDWKADVCSHAGYFNMPNSAATVYVDSNLNRYIRLSNGQLFSCSNTDLISLHEPEKINLRAYLTGLID
jgi:hypothetical protein